MTVRKAPNVLDSFNFAFEGIIHVLRTQRNMRIHFAIAFVGADEMRGLKRDHLGVDEATDVLSFPIDGRDPLPDGIQFVEFGHKDVVRHKLVQRIVEAYKEHTDERNRLA